MSERKPRPAQRLVERASVGLAAALIATRPLIADFDWAAYSALIWHALALAGMACALIAAAPARTMPSPAPGWRFGPAGLIAALLLLILLPAALRGPEPTDALAFWLSLAIHLGFAWHCCNVLPDRSGLGIAALCAGLAGTLVLALGQAIWVLPGSSVATAAMTRGETPEFLDDLRERLAHGGAFARFGLSNGFAAYLILLIPVLFGVLLALRGQACQLGRQLGRQLLAPLCVAVLLLGSLWALAATGSKGAMAALVVAAIAGLLCARAVPLALRLGVAAVGLAGLIAGSVLFADGIAASTTVRLGYWHGALALIHEAPLTGHGLGAFALESPRALPLWSGPVTDPHSEPLAASVDAGVLAGTLFLIFCVTLVFGRARGAAADPQAPVAPAVGPAVVGTAVVGTAVARTAAPAPPLAHAVMQASVTQNATSRRLVVIAVFAIAAYTALFDALANHDSNLGHWPGGASFLVRATYGLLLAGVVTTVAGFALRLPTPPTLAVRVGLAALALHACQDFSFHHAGVLGTAAVLAALIGGTRLMRTSARLRTVAALAVLVLLLVGTAVAVRGRAHARAEEIAQLARQAMAQGAWMPPQLAALRDLAGIRGGPDRDVAATALETGLDLAAHSPRRQLDLLACMPPGSTRIARAEALVAAHPHLVNARLCLAEDHLASGRPAAALDELRASIALAPAYLPLRQRLITALARAADAPGAAPADATAWRAEAERERQRIAELNPIVYFRNRTKPTATSSATTAAP